MSGVRLSQGVLEFCLRILERVDKLYEVKKGFGKSFRTRCRSIPELIEDVGVATALAFAYSKAGKELYSKVFKFMERGDGAVNFKSEDEENVGYALFLYATLKWLAEKKLVQSDVSDVDSVLDELSRVPPMKLSMVTSILRPMYNMLSELADAKYK